MTIYQAMTLTIDSFAQTGASLAVDGVAPQPIAAMVDAATIQRDLLTVEAASCELL